MPAITSSEKVPYRAGNGADGRAKIGDVGGTEGDAGDQERAES